MSEKKIKKISNMDENTEQKYICSWCIQHGLVPVAVVNGFNLNGMIKWARMNGLSEKPIKTNNAIQLKQLKAEGLHTGMPDMIIYSDDKMCYLENKVKGNTTSEAQKKCHEWLSKIGYTVLVSSSSVDAITQLKKFFDNPDKEKNKICHDYMKEKWGL